MSKEKQVIGGDKLPNNFGGGFSRSKSNAPKIGGAGGSNATGPDQDHNRGKQLDK